VRPAYSVILFTTLSGAGYGLLAVLGVMLLVGARLENPMTPLIVGLALASAGLIASTFHLGRPERAWRALSQWRTSWLSREGMAALAVYAVALPLGALAIWGGQGGIALRLLAAAMVILAATTVWCTAMIYASLKPVPQWRHPSVLPAYLLLALATGTLLMGTLLPASAAGTQELRRLALVALAAAWLAKEAYWRAAGRPLRGLTPASATGLNRLSPVRALEAPHTESNYLLHEMGYGVARRHAGKLRRATRILTFGLPIAISLILLGLTPSPAVKAILAAMAALASMAGTLVERWLFFAEARHTVTLYYRDQRV
jgi:sulfite dehydrogenase (quinone) subunit SoeC